MIETATYRTNLHKLLVSLFLVIVGMTAVVMYMNDGQFIYSLDDPYIHLTLSKHIADGHYGFNAGEFSAPSSSILWPFLLAPFAAFSWHELVPLVINVIACLLTAAVVYNILHRKYPAAAGRITFFLLLLTNTVGLVFNGMEHSLQVLCAVLIVKALIDFSEDKPLSKWLPVVLVAAPLIRYEMFALVYGTTALLVFHRRYQYVIYAGLATLLAAAFSWFLWHNSGVPLPSSVMIKMGVKSSTVNGMALLVVAILLQFLALRLTKSNRGIWGIQTIFCALIAHWLFGKTGWLSRYEVYILVGSLVAFIYYLRSAGLLRKPILHGCIALMLLPVYFFATLSIPAMSNGIYAQHVQMTRLAKIAGVPKVAVNDIGYVGYKSGAYVYDLVGLANMETGKFFIHKQYKELLAGVEARGIKLVMIYPDWFSEESIPAHWQKLGDLELLEFNGQVNHLGAMKVDFYATSSGAAEELAPAINKWKRDLPENTAWRPGQEHE